MDRRNLLRRVEAAVEVAMFFSFALGAIAVVAWGTVLLFRIMQVATR